MNYEDAISELMDMRQVRDIHTILEGGLTAEIIPELTHHNLLFFYNGINNYMGANLLYNIPTAIQNELSLKVF